MLLSEADWARHLADETLAGLQDEPPWTPPVWFYDAVGSDLFDQITRLPEYYPTRAERAILHALRERDRRCRLTPRAWWSWAPVRPTRPGCCIEALRAHGTLERIVPVDCSRVRTGRCGRAVSDRVPRTSRSTASSPTSPPICPSCRAGRTACSAFLGSTIGNFTADGAPASSSPMSPTHLRPGDSFLLGTDLVKTRGRLVAAYNDPAGVTAAFNLNALDVMNRHLGADFDPHAYRHEAVWDRRAARIEMRLVATQPPAGHASPGSADHRLTLAPGEWIRTEISAKFTPAQVGENCSPSGWHRFRSGATRGVTSC